VGFGEIFVNVALRIDNRRLTLRTNQVRRVRKTAKIELFEKHLIDPIGLIAIYKTRGRVSKAGASNTAAACRRVNIDPRAASSRATSCKPHATSACRQKCRPADRQPPPRARARPGASSAFPKSDQDAQGKSCSDARLRLSTRCALCLHPR